MQLQLPVRNSGDHVSHQRWITALGVTFAALGRYASRFGQLYGSQFHATNAASQELLSSEYCSDKLLSLWDTLAADIADPGLARYIRSFAFCYVLAFFDDTWYLVPVPVLRCAELSCDVH